METVEIISAEAGVTLGWTVRHGHVLYFVTCERIPGIQAFHNIEQAVQCFGLELLIRGATANRWLIERGGIGG